MSNRCNVSKKFLSQSDFSVHTHVFILLLELHNNGRRLYSFSCDSVRLQHYFGEYSAQSDATCFEFGVGTSNSCRLTVHLPTRESVANVVTKLFVGL